VKVLTGPLAQQPFTVRIHPNGEKPMPSREERFTTKREALRFIAGLGELSFVQKVERRTYSLRVKPRKT
jgi:hypothetical protein